MKKEVDVIMTKENIWRLKIIVTGMLGWISNKMGIFAQILPALVVLMVLDQISGVLAAKKKKRQKIREILITEYRAEKMRVGIYKKAGYIFAITVAMASDYMIRNFGAFVGIEVSDKVNFGMLITIWLSITELLSILENIQRLGVNMPGFLEKYLDELRNKIEKEKVMVWVSVGIMFWMAV